MSKIYKVFIMAGEESGDILAASLIQKIKLLTGGKVEFAGIGGYYMKSENIKCIFSIEDISCIGIFEVFKKLPNIYRIIKRTVNFIKNFNPDVIIAIDAQEFSKLVFKKLPMFKRVLYVAPTVWAWRSWRAKKVKGYTDLLLTVFDFEEEIFKKFDCNVSYVGHPLIENKYIISASDQDFRNKYLIKKNYFCLLPGSRKSEITKLLPIFISVAKILKARYGYEAIIVTPFKEVELVNSIIQTENFKCLVVSNQEDKYNAISGAKFAIASSGTVALELGILEIPTVITYKANIMTAILVKFLIKLKWVSLVNIIMNKKIMPELLQWDCSVEKILQECSYILESTYQKTELAKFKKKMINHIDGVPSEIAAKKILDLIAA